MKFQEFNRYRVFLGAGQGPTNVFCYMNDDLQAQLTFIDVHFNQLPAPTKREDGALLLCYPMRSLSAMLDLLRNERPLYLLYDQAKNIAYVSTGDEDIGEAELELLRKQ